MTKCRCGHGPQAHRRVYGRSRRPCWAVTDREAYLAAARSRGAMGKRSGLLCRCRDYIPQEVRA